MVDRIETRPLNNKIDLRLQTLITSPYAKHQLQLAGLINQRGHVITSSEYLRSLSQRKYQRRAREALTKEIILRALNYEQVSRRGRHHNNDVTRRRIIDNNNAETSNKQHRKQSHGRKIPREKSAPGYLKVEYDSEQRTRVTSAHNRKATIDNDVTELNLDQNPIEPLDKVQVSSEERHACELTMSYGFKTVTNNKEQNSDEIVVMQQHTTGENVVIYRGFLTEGDSFSFKSERRPASPLSLAFYAKGFIDSIVNDCCEFRYNRRNQHMNEHSKFFVERVRKANPCENCRKRYFQKNLASNSANTPPGMVQEDHASNILRSCPTPTPELSIDNRDQISPDINSTEIHRNKKRIHFTKHKETLNPNYGNEITDKQINNEQQSKKLSSRSASVQKDVREPTRSVDFSLLEYTLMHDSRSSKQKPSSKTMHPSIMKGSSKKRSAEAISRKKTMSPSSPDSEHMHAWVTQLDIAPREARSSVGSLSTLDAENIFQTPSSATDVQQQIQLQEITNQAKCSNVVRPEKSVENFIYIFDGTIAMSDEDKKRLHGLINYGSIFENINDKACIDFISPLVNEQIIIIVSSKKMEILDRSIYNALQIHSIYVIDSSSSYSNSLEKIRGIYLNLVNVLDQLEEDLTVFTHNLNMITSISTNDNSFSHFAYIQILKDIITEVDDKIDSKQEMIDYCRHAYADNEIQLKFIDEFERRFRENKVLKWYLRQETFLFKMLTRAFRIPEPDLLFKLRFFIKCLDRQLKSHLLEETTTSTTPPLADITVYRTQHIPIDIFDLLLKNQGGYLSFSPFLVANKSKITSKLTNTLSSNRSQLRLVQFQMELDTKTPKMDIKKSQKELIIGAATIFRIINIEQRNKGISVVRLVNNENVLNSARELIKNLHEVTCDVEPLLRLIKLTKQMEYMQHAEYFGRLLLNDPIIKENEGANSIVGGLFHALGSHYYEKGKYDNALEQLQNSLKVYLHIFEPDDLALTPTYNNMGSVYHRQGLDEQALHYHTMAYDIQVKSTNPDPESIAAYAGNIASVLLQQGKYDEAIPYLRHDLEIRQKLHPNGDDVNLAVKYHNLAGAQFRIGKYTEALKNYEECLKIELKSHSDNHPTVAITYYNMATTLEALGKLKQAIDKTKKAIERLLLTKDPNDEEIQNYKEYEKRLQQKLTLKKTNAT